jgi:hypothetical protein
MKPSPITEDLEWQLFELLEGNLPPNIAEQLQQRIEKDIHLQAHYQALAQTYSIPTSTEFPEKESLKKRSVRNTIYFYTSLSAAAAVAILWFFNANRAIQPVQPQQLRVAQNTLSEQPLASALEPPVPSANSVRYPIARKIEYANTKFDDPNNVHELVSAITNTSPSIHPLITATEPIRKVRNINDSAKAQPVIIQRSPSILANTNNQPPSPKIAQQKTKKELLKSFYQDARRMIENGHVPHINVRTVNKDQDWMPEFQVGLTIENNVILTSFNPEQ